ncbi:MAG: oligosaccharide flippase family protein [Bacteroidia bacterium]|nr:oligosaccharide flippase family protein [Bacteroidia bacterium]
MLSLPKNAIKSLFANISIVILLNLLIKPIWLLVEMGIQDEVGHAEWGMYGALLSFGFLFLSLSDLGINQYTTKMIAGKPELMASYFPNLFAFKLLIMILYPVAMVGVGSLIGYDQRQIYFLFLLCFVHGGGQMMEFFRANIRASQKFKLDGFLSVAERILLLLLTAYLFFTQLTIDRFIYARLIAIGLTVLLFYALIIRLYGWFRPRLNLPFVKNIVKSSLGLALMTILYSVHDKVDQVMLERLRVEDGAVQNGLYAAAYRWLEAMSMFLWTVLPIFFARFAFFVEKPKEQERLLHFGQVITAIPLIFVAVWVWFYAELLLFPFDQSTTEELGVIAACLRAIFIALAINGCFAIFSTLLTSTGHESKVNVMAIASVLLNIVLNVIFIPEYGAIASAWTTVGSYALLSICYLAYIQFFLEIQVPYSQTIRLFLLAALLWGLFYALQMLDWPWWVVSGICFLFTLAASFLLRLITLAKIKSFQV